MNLARFKSIFSVFAVLAVTAILAVAQDASQGSPGERPTQPDDQPKNVREMMVKMKIDEEKKEYNEMLDRSKEALKLSGELERDYSTKNQLTRDDYDKLANIEKLVKKVRGSLGGEDRDDTSDDDDDAMPNNPADAIKALGSLTSKLVDELNKTSRFGVSVVAIQSSNAVLKVCRFLRFSK
jgi:hypothetical protein